MPFDAFFNNPEGTTPTRLLLDGIYNEIAVPLKGGAYRPVSMALLARAVSAKIPDVATLPAGSVKAVPTAEMRIQRGTRSYYYNLHGVAVGQP